MSSVPLCFNLHAPRPSRSRRFDACGGGIGVMSWKRRDAEFAEKTCRRKPLRSLRLRVSRPASAKMATCSLSNRHQLEKVVRGFFDPELFLDDMRYFVLFEDDGDLPIKKIAVEITSKLKASTTVDWQVRDSVRRPACKVAV